MNEAIPGLGEAPSDARYWAERLTNTPDTICTSTPARGPKPNRETDSATEPVPPKLKNCSVDRVVTPHAMPKYATAIPLRIAEALAIPPQKVAEVVRFLISTGLIVEKIGRLAMGPASIHLGSDSSMISKHHTNWRMRAIQSLDVPRVRAALVRALEEVRAIVKPSPEEEVYAYSLDLFRMA